MISAETIDEVRRRADAISVIQEHVEIAKKGRSYVGLCPFHEERTASFHVYQDNGRFVCFGCGAKGDVFEFVKRMTGKTFPVVVRELAERVGVNVPESRTNPTEGGGQDRQMALIRKACEKAAEYWQQHLWGQEGDKAREALAERKIDEKTARTFRLGYALPGWHGLHRALQNADFSEEVLQTAGLLARTQGGGKTVRYYDRFRERIMFPIDDPGGRIVAFGGRSIGSGSEAGPLYLNSPESPVYEKRRSLFGIHLAREAIRRTGRAILVEGYFDVLALHQAGVAITVSPCGTAVSSAQMDMLRCVGCRELVLLFDHDEAGLSAPERNGPILLRSGITTRVADLASSVDVDPDVFVHRHGVAELERVLAGAVFLTEYLINKAIHRFTGGRVPEASVEHKLDMVRYLTPFVLATKDDLTRSAFERCIARRLDLDIVPLRDEVLKAKRYSDRAAERRS